MENGKNVKYLVLVNMPFRNFLLHYINEIITYKQKLFTLGNAKCNQMFFKWWCHLHFQQNNKPDNLKIANYLKY